MITSRRAATTAVAVRDRCRKRYLTLLTETEHDVRAAAEGDPWKAAVAAAMKTSTTASNPWLAAQLNAGSPFRLTRLVSTCRANPRAFQP